MGKACYPDAFSFFRNKDGYLALHVALHNYAIRPKFFDYYIGDPVPICRTPLETGINMHAA